MVVAVATPNKITGNGNGSGTIFSFSPMVIYASTDMVVTHVTSAGVETLLTEGTGASAYAVVVSLYPGAGSIRYPEDEVTPLPSGESIVMKPVYPIEQQTNLDNQGGYDANIQEIQFDKLLKIDRQQQEVLDRTITFPISYAGNVAAEIPSPTVALRYLRINSALTALEWAAVSTTTADASDVDPLALALVAAPGVAADFAREDHAHPVINSLARTFTNVTINDTSNFIHADGVHIKCRNVSGGTLSKGVPVYASGWNSGQSATEILAADADDASKMPALGLIDEDIANNANGHIMASGYLAGDATYALDTSAFSDGDDLYISTTTGVLTATRPVGTAELVQPIAKVLRSHASLGVLHVDGPGHQALSPNNNMVKGADIASAAALVIGTDGERFDVTGTTTITSMTTNADRWFVLQFDGILTLTHHATNLILPGGVNIVTAAGGIGIFFATGANTVECINYSDGSTGTVLQEVEMTVAVATGTTTIPWDGTAPAVGEGTEIASQAIVLANNTNKVRITGGIQASIDNASDGLTVALFRGSTCIASIPLHNVSAIDDKIYSFSVLDDLTTAGSVTYSVRIGAETSGGWQVYATVAAGSAGGTSDNNSFFLEEIAA